MGARGRMRRAGSLVLLFAAVACAREAGLEQGLPARVGIVGPDSVSGVVRQVGNLPFAHTIVEGERDTVVVEGEYEEEIVRLVGAVVRVTGERTAGGFPGPRLRATSYEILSVDGERPQVGVLDRDEEGFLLRPVPDASGGREEEDAEEGPARAARLGVVPLRFESLVGARMWVVTDENGTVLRYGILREPPGLSFRSLR